MMKMLKGLPGFFIFLSVLFAAHYFVIFTFTGPTIFLAAVLSYGLGLLIMAYPKRAAILILAIVLSISAVIVVDYGLGRIEKSQSGTMTLDEDVSFWVQSASEETSHFALAQWVKSKLINKWGLQFGQWLVYDRISGQLIFGEPSKLGPEKDIPFTPVNEEQKQLKMFEWVFMVACGILIFAGVQLLLSKWVGPIGLYAPMIFYIVLWYQYMDLSWGVYGCYIYGVMVYGIMRHVEKLKVAFKGEDMTYYPSFKIWLFAIFGSALLFLLATTLFLFVPIKTLNVGFDVVLPNVWGARSEYDTKQFRLYSLGETNFQGDSGYLGGPVGAIDGASPLFWLTLTQPIEKSLYLKSQVKTIYNGQNWAKRQQTYQSRYANYLKTPENTRWLSSENPDYIKGGIAFDQMKTISIFSPIGFYASSLSPDKVFVSEENQAFYKGGMFVRFIKEYAFEASQRDFTPPVPEDLVVSETLETEVVTIARTLGSYGASPQKKIGILQQYLSKYYTYNLQVSSKRVNPDFVSNFLLETKEGYCTYFASALVQMARINNIPARYVEGFRVDPGEVNPENLVAKITEKDAHAWVEVYYEDEGWRVVEATPPYMASAAAGADQSVEAALAEMEAAKKRAQALAQDAANADAIDFDALQIENGGANQRGERDIDGGFTPEEQGGFRAARQNYNLVLTMVTTAICLLIALIWWWPVITRFKRINHSKVVALIYGFSALLYITRKQGTMELEAQLTSVKIDPFEKALWLRILYDKKRNIETKDIEMAASQLRSAFAREFEYFRRQNGWINYWQTRLLNRI